MWVAYIFGRVAFYWAVSTRVAFVSKLVGVSKKNAKKRSFLFPPQNHIRAITSSRYTCFDSISRLK